MAVAARTFGRRPREDQGATNTAASLGAVLELLRALNWMIRADVPWPTKRGQSFDFVLVGEPGAFALCVTDEDVEGVEDAAAGLSSLLGGTRVQPIVCRSSASLGTAHPQALFCTPETALDLLIGLAPHEVSEEIRKATSLLRDLEVPLPPEPEPEPEPEAEPEPVAPPVVVAPPVAKPAKVKPVEVKAAPVKAAPVKAAPVKTEVKPVETERVETKPVESKPVKPVEPKVEAPKPTAKIVKAAVAPVVEAPKVAEPPVERAIEVAATAPIKPEPPRPPGRHRSERPRRALTPRRTPPSPPETAESEPPASTLALPTALVPPPGRVRGGDDAGQRFDNNYVYVPEPATGPGPLRREFRASAFLKGIVAIVVVVLAAGAAVRAWPHVSGLIHTNLNPTAAFGQTIRVGTTDYHPKLALTATLPHKLGSAKGYTSYGVDFRVANAGATTWPLPATSAFVVFDSLGESHALSSISGAKAAPWSGSLRPTRNWSGRLTFKIRSNRTPLRLRLLLAGNHQESVTWIAQ